MSHNASDALKGGGEGAGIAPRCDASAKAIGVVRTINGSATIVRAGGVTVPVHIGIPVYQKDVIVTDSDGVVGITFRDGTAFNLGASTCMVLEEFVSDSGTLNSALFSFLRGTFNFILGKTAKSESLSIETPFATIRTAARGGGRGVLTLAAFTFAIIKELEAASQQAAYLDDDVIRYQDLEHGTFEIVTKEANARTITIDNPGITVVIRPTGSGGGYNVDQAANSPARMLELYSASRAVAQTFSLGQQDSFIQQHRRADIDGNDTTGSIIRHVGTMGSEGFFVAPLSLSTGINLNSPSSATATALKLDDKVVGSDVFAPLLPTQPSNLALGVIGPSGLIELVGVTGSNASDTTGGSLPLTGANPGGAIAVSSGLVSTVWSAGPSVPSGLNGTLAAALSTSVTNDSLGTGMVSYAFSAPDHTFDFLAAGETLVITYSLTITDGLGSSTQPIMITVNGTNDAPRVTAVVSTGAIQEDALPAIAAGTIDFFDADITDSHTVSVTPAAGGYIGTFTPVISNVSTGDGAGQVSWTFGVDDAELGSIAFGQTIAQVYTVTITDAQGASIDQNVSVVIAGDNLVITLTGGTSLAEGDAATYTINLSKALGAGVTASVDIAITLPNGLTGAEAADFVNAFLADVAIAVAATPGVSLAGTTLTFDSNFNVAAGFSFNLAAFDDALVEGAESYTVALSGPASSTGAAVGLGADAVVTTITDNDTASWSISGPSNVLEGGTAVYTVNLSGALSAGESGSIVLSLTHGTTTSADFATAFDAAVAAAVAIYNSGVAPGSLTYSAGTLTFTSDGTGAMGALQINLAAFDDALVEGAESYTVALSGPASSTGAAVGLGADAVVTTITDNDTASWSISGPSNVLEGGTAVYTVNLSGALSAGESGSIVLSLTHGTTTSADFATAFDAAVAAAVAIYNSGVAPGSLTYSAGTLTFTSDGTGAMGALQINLAAFDDALVEGAESYTVALSGPASSTGAAVGLGADAVVTTITDNDTASWSISGPSNVLEGGTAVYTVNLSGALSAGESGSIVLSLTHGTTTSADFATAFDAAVAAAVAIYNSGVAPGSLTYSAGTLTFTSDGTGAMGALQINLAAFDDALVEGAESYTVALSGPASSTGAAVGLGADAVVTTITDNDTASWSISGPSNVLEGGTAVYTVNLSGALSAGESGSIVLSLTHGTTTSADFATAFDAAVAAAVAIYNSGVAPGSLTYSAGTLTFTSDGTGAMGALQINLAAFDDALVEGAESYTVALSGPASSTGAAVGLGADAVVTTITDNDTASWSISGPSNVLEGGTAVYTVNLSGALSAGESGSIVLSLTHGTTTSADFATAFDAAVAAAVAIYNSGVAPGSLTYSAGTLTFTSDGTGAMGALQINLAAFDDALVEGAESYTVALSGPASSTGAAVGLGADAVVTTITDNDTASWSISGPSNVLEGGTAVYTVNLSGALSAGESGSIVLSLTHGTTTSADFATAFDAAVAAAVAIYNSGVAPGSLTYSAGTLTFTSDGTGAMGALQINLAAFDDALVEGAESYTVALSGPASSTGAAVGLGADAVVTTITDNDTASWSISGPSNVLEGGTAVYTVNLSGALSAGESGSIVLSLTHGTTTSADFATAFDAAVAAAVAIYNSGVAPGSLTYSAGTLTFTSDGTGAMGALQINLAAFDDALVEGAESYTVALSGPASSTGAAVGLGADAVVTTITDNDTASWSISGPSNVLEGGTAVYTVNLSGALSAGESGSIVLSLTHGTTTSADFATAFDAAVAAAVAIYNSGVAPGSLTYSAGTLTFTSDGTGAMGALQINLAAFDDALVEGAESYTVALSGPASSTGAAVGLGADAVVTTITDNDTASWSISGPSNVLEGGTAVYTVNLSGALSAGESGSIVLSLTHGTTTSADFATAFDAAVAAAVAIYNSGVAPGSLTYSAGTLTFTSDGTGAMGALQINLAAFDDALVEGAESYTVALSGPASSTGAAVGLGADAVVTTITDNDTASWSISGPSNVLEGGTAVYTVNLSGALSAGESGSIVLSLTHGTTTSADFATAFDAAVAAAVAIYNSGVAPGSLTYSAGTLTFTSDGTGAMGALQINLAAFDDALVEGAESYTVALSGPASSTGAAVGLGADAVVTTITDNDTASWSISGPSNVLEGGTAVYTVNLSGALSAGESGSIVLSLTHGTTTSADFATAFDAAVAAAVAIYNSGVAPGSLTYSAGTLTFTSDGTGAMGALQINLAAFDDALVEGAESYTVALSGPASSTGAAVGLGADAVVTTITDNDTASWSISGPSNVLEGGTAVYTVNLSGALSAGESGSIVLSLTHGTTTSADFATAFDAAVAAAVAIYNSGVAPGSLTYSAGTLTFTSDGTGAMGALQINLAAFDDALVEGAESYTVALSGPASSTGAAVGLGADAVVTTITDNDTASWSISGPSNVLEGGTAVYTVNLSGALSAGESGSIVLSLTHGTTTSADFATAFDAAVAAAVAIYNSGVAPGSLTYSAGTLTFTSDGTGAMGALQINLAAFDDALVEGAESYTVALSGPASSTGAAVGLGADAVVTTITDNDTASWSISGPSNVLEGGTAVYTVNLSGALSAGESGSIVLSLTHGTTTSADFATAFDAAVAAAVAIYNSGVAPGSLTYSAGTLTFTSDGTGAMGALQINLAAFDDALVEGAESYTVALSGPASSTGAAVGLGADAVVTTITDNDTASWSISGPSNVLEGGTAVYTVNLSGALSAGESGSIVLSLTHGTTTSADFATAFDAAVAAAVAIYNSGVAPGSLTYSAGTLTFTSDGTGAMGALQINLAAFDDALVEGAESYTVALSGPASSTGAAVGLGADAVVTTITDNDTASWSISGPSNVLEGGTAVYTVNLSGALSAGESGSIVLSLTHGTTTSADFATAFDAAVAAAVAIYNSGVAPGSLTYSAGTLTFTSDGTGAMGALQINLAAFDDALVEGAESYTVALSGPASSTGAAVGLGADAVVTTITDNDTASWSISGPSNVLEGGTAVYTVNLSGALSAGESGSIVLSLTHGTTTSADFATAFDAAVAAAVAIYNSGVAPGSLTYSAGTLTFTSDGTGAMGALQINLAAFDDALVEGAESYTVALSGPASSTGAAVGLGADAVVTTITDNDTASWSISGPSNVLEGGTAVYTVNLSGALSAGESGSIVLSLTHGTTTSADFATAFDAAVAAAVAIYNSGVAPGSLTYSAGTLTFTSDGTGAMGALQINLAAFDDALVEGAESYTVALSGPASSTGAAVGLGADAVVTTITDNDTADPNDFDDLTGTPGRGNGVSGGDTIVGTDGNDTALGPGGPKGDTFFGGRGNDSFNGNPGDDLLYGQAGSDTLFGANDNDTIYGGSGNDSLSGNNGNDLIYGGSGNDTIDGGDGNDIVVGGYGSDSLRGGSGQDTFLYLSILDSLPSAPDTITDFVSGEDKIDVSAIDSGDGAGGVFAWGETTATAHGVWYTETGGATILNFDTDGVIGSVEMSITMAGTGLGLDTGDIIK